MRIGNAKLFLDGTFILGSLTVENGRIAAIGGTDLPCDVDAGGSYLIPGLVDIHTHGAVNEDFSDGAVCAGIHLEGLFLSYGKRGAQAAENLHKPDVAMFHRLNDASGGQVRLVTIAPEEEGAIPFIREVSQQCTVS